MGLVVVVVVRPPAVASTPSAAPFGGGARVVPRTGVVPLYLPVTHDQRAYAGCRYTLYTPTCRRIRSEAPAHPGLDGPTRKPRCEADEVQTCTVRARHFRRRTRDLHALRKSGTHHTDGRFFYAAETVNGRGAYAR